MNTESFEGGNNTSLDEKGKLMEEFDNLQMKLLEKMSDEERQRLELLEYTLKEKMVKLGVVFQEI